LLGASARAAFDDGNYKTVACSLAKLWRFVKIAQKFSRRIFFTNSSSNEPGQTSKGLEKQVNNQTKRKNHDCPCRKKNNIRKHPWKPKEYRKIVLALGDEPGIPTKITSETVEHIIKRLKEPQWQSLRKYLIKNGLNPQKGGKPGFNETFQNKDIIAAVLCPTNDPNLQIPYIANYHISGDFIAMVLEQTLSKAGKLNLISIKAHSTCWKPAHNAHEPKQSTDSLTLHEETNSSQSIHKKTSETLFPQHF
jgi:hypothetical protein